MAENPRIEELRRRVRADPASIAFAALAEELRRIGRYEDAIETCRMGLQRHPAYLSARVTLGRALIETGEYDAAREELETVLRSAPENIAALRGIEQIRERLGHSTEMDPELVMLANRPIRVAPPPAPDSAPEPTLAPAPEPAPAAPPEPSGGLGTFAIPLASAAASEPQAVDEPVDIFSAALQKSAAPAMPVHDAEPETEAEADLPPISIELPSMAFEPATIAFQAPVMPAQPAPHVAAALMRLERFLGAIQTARHA